MTQDRYIKGGTKALSMSTFNILWL